MWESQDYFYPHIIQKLFKKKNKTKQNYKFKTKQNQKEQTNQTKKQPNKQTKTFVIQYTPSTFNAIQYAHYACELDLNTRIFHNKNARI